MNKEKFYRLPEEEKYAIFCQGISVGERKIVDGKFSWCRQYNDFYILKTMDFDGKEEYIAFRNPDLIEPFLQDVSIPADLFGPEP